MIHNYAPGMLQRTAIGQQQVQGLNYGYTLKGWLIGVNSTSCNSTTYSYDSACNRILKKVGSG